MRTDRNTVVDILPVQLVLPRGPGARTGVPCGHHTVAVVVSQVAVDLQEGSWVVGDIAEEYETAKLETAGHGLWGKQVCPWRWELDPTTGVSVPDDWRWLQVSCWLAIGGVVVQEYSLTAGDAGPVGSTRAGGKSK